LSIPSKRLKKAAKPVKVDRRESANGVELERDLVMSHDVTIGHRTPGGTSARDRPVMP